MAAKKYYAVKKGKKTGIFASWAECKLSVTGYSGAEYKGFETLKQAQQYLGTEEKIEDTRLYSNTEKSKENVKLTEDSTAISKNIFSNTKKSEKEKLLVYVDGSYHHALKKYAFGCIFLLPDGRIYIEYGNGDNPKSLQHRNVTGEMLGAMFAVRTAMLNRFSSVEICYDYQGIEKWVTGEWKSKTELTQKYAQSMRKWGESIQITFTKVAAHTNVYYNELADQTAKKGLTEGNGIPKIRPFEQMQCFNSMEMEN